MISCIIYDDFDFVAIIIVFCVGGQVVVNAISGLL